MRTQLSPKMERIAHIASKFPFVKQLLKPFYYRYKQHILTNRSQCLHSEGIRVLSEFDRIMTENKITYTVYAGTLLGAIRERGMLKHDLDIDTAIWNKDFGPHIEKALQAGGFKLARRFEVEGGRLGREDTFVKDGVDIDIYYIYCDEKGTHNTDYKTVEGAANFYDSMLKYGRVDVRRCDLPVSYETERVPFENIEVSAIRNAREWLEKRYGKDYMVPNPKYRDTGREKNIYLWENVKATYTMFD